MKKKYVHKNFALSTFEVISQANEVINKYIAQGYQLTLRQLYYQFVAHDMFPDDRTWRQVSGSKWVRDPNGTKNAEPNYKWLGGIINDGRLAGLIDWKAIEDRTRNLQALPHWDSPGEIVEYYSSYYHIDKWENQPVHPEVWIEKDALVGVIENICDKLDVSYFACRGYCSQSEMWNAGQRLLRKKKNGKLPIIFYLGDHDPSGIDMTRDIEERLKMFAGTVKVERLALNMDQVEEYDPPPNPAKLTDSRCAGYIEEYGDESWELDAMEPSVLSELVEDAVTGYRQDDLWEEKVEEEREGREKLEDIAKTL